MNKKKSGLLTVTVLMSLMMQSVQGDIKIGSITIPSTNMTQSEAHLSIPAIRNAVEHYYKLSQTPYFQELFNGIVARERQFNGTHYVFYNGTSNPWRVPQDLYLKLYAKFHPGAADIKDFRAFRWLPVDQTTPKDLLKKEFLEHGMINDVDWHVRANLMSTNLALFGNVGLVGECTFEYFLRPLSHAVVNDDIFKAILGLFGVTNADPYLRQIASLADTYLISEPLRNFPNSDPQMLSQIFIPKEMVDHVAYVSWRHGIPYEDKLVNWFLTQTQTQFGANPIYSKEREAEVAKKGAKTLETSLANVRELFKDKKEGHPLFKKILEGIEQGKYRISTVLDEYKATPEFIPGLNSLQARLIVTPSCVGNVKANVQVFDYDRIPQELKDAYNKELDALVEKIFAERVAAGVRVQPETDAQRQAAEQQLRTVCYAQPRAAAPTTVSVSNEPAILVQQ